MFKKTKTLHVNVLFFFFVIFALYCTTLIINSWPICWSPSAFLMVLIKREQAGLMIFLWLKYWIWTCTQSIGRPVVLHLYSWIYGLFFGKLMTLCCLCQDASPLGLCWLNGLSWRIFLFVLQKTSFKQSLLPNESDIWMLCSAKLMSSFTELTTKLKSMFFSSKNIKCNYAAWTLINIFDEAFSGFVAVTFVSDETRCRVSCHILSLCLSPPCVCFKC